ncbi:hypothetical protein BJ980_001672 [Nocardioides daedukensis]|uniref:Uncharacterized protein n=1 Tax=Nocardioides daedukensis TaxID=634462 RepID=A0A7Y9S2X7_9ACTN|nr:hypothetical protein [Nocardioides daedukensis]NYG58749.1 hypothetical protein [Nocardioides daedukensis]
MKRALAVVLGLLVACLGLAAPASAVAQPSSPAGTVYGYDTAANPSTVTHIGSERGPPAGDGNSIDYHLDGLLPSGEVARPDDLTTVAIYDYDDLSQFVPIAPRSRAAKGQVARTEVTSAVVERSRVAAKSGGALAKYDADFAIGQLTKGGRGTASGLVDVAESQGWKAAQSSGGPLKYVDSNGIERLVIKRGSARTPGSDFPHVAIRNASGQRVDSYGNVVSRKSPGNHTPITWDLP